MTRFVGLAGLLSLVVARTWAQDAPAPPTAPRPGAVLPAPPSELPPTPLPAPSVDRIRAHLEVGDTERALDVAERLVATAKWSRERDAAYMVIGLLNREAGKYNLASEAFTQVRAGGGPLAPAAAVYEAEQDLLRGRPWAAIQECEAIQKARPDTDDAENCDRIVALAHASAGEAAAARLAAATYDRAHPHGPIAEQVEVKLARRWSSTRPDAAVAMWRQLALHHDTPLTGRLAERELARLGQALPDDVPSQMARALSLRDSGRIEEAWTAFEALRAASATDPALARWVAENEERFGWRTRHWDGVIDGYLADYQTRKDANVAWSRYKVLGRAGRFGEASDWALAMQKVHGRGTAFYRAEEDIGRTMMLAGRYPEAVAQFDQVAGRGGWSGRRAAQLAAFATFVGGSAEEAVTRFDAVLAATPENVEARYWRSRALTKVGRTEDAALDRTFVLSTEPWSWYATLFRQDEGGRPSAEPFARNGTWPGRSQVADAPAAPIFELPLESAALTVEPAGFRTTASRQVSGDLHLAAMTWPWSPTPPPPSLPWVRGELAIPDTVSLLPRSYRASRVFDPTSARKEFGAFANANAERFPELTLVADLAAVGLYEEAGTRFSSFYRQLREDSSKGNRAARKLLEDGGERWRTWFLATRDHHDTARSLYEVWVGQPEPAATELQRLGFPLAHDRYVWTHSKDHGVDPLLVLGLMRQESTYNNRAVSRAGARGPMQIMPRTGHLLADLANNEAFDAGDLSDPELAAEYGIGYLGLLLQRFDGVYPLAVAAYNGGPHNVSSWMQGPARDLPMDQFVEHIPFRETRDYVKKVSEGYATYVSLYAPDGSVLAVPDRALGDHPEIVDF